MIAYPLLYCLHPHINKYLEAKMLLSAQDGYSIMIIPVFLQGVLSLWVSKGARLQRRANARYKIKKCKGIVTDSENQEKSFPAGSFEMGPLFCYNMGLIAEFAEDEG